MGVHFWFLLKTHRVERFPGRSDIWESGVGEGFVWIEENGLSGKGMVVFSKVCVFL